MNTLEECREFFAKDIFAMKQANITIDSAQKNEAICTMHITPEHLNADGFVMGGAIYTLADFTFAVAANFDNPPTVTLSSSINFFRPGIGDKLTSHASLVNESRTTVIMTVVVNNPEGKKVAMATFTGFRKA